MYVERPTGRFPRRGSLRNGGEIGAVHAAAPPGERRRSLRKKGDTARGEGLGGETPGRRRRVPRRSFLRSEEMSDAR